MKNIVPALLCAVAMPAWAQVTAAQARGVFDRIRTTPSELKLHCEQLQLQEESVKASMRRDSAALKDLRKRIDAIRDQLPGYRDATKFATDKASAEAGWADTPEGKSMDEAQRKLGDACLPPERK